MAEIAHIIAASDEGPRGVPTATADERRAYENLILLCPNCHTAADTDVEGHPPELLQRWKAEQRERIDEALGVRRYDSREDARKAIEPHLRENRAVWDQYSPDTNHKFDPESEVARAWQHAVVGTLIPNNEAVLRVLVANEDLLTDDEQSVLAEFKVHAEGFAQRHLSEEEVPAVPRFPEGLAEILR